MDYIFIVILAFGLLPSSKCGIIDRTVDTMGNAAETLHEGVGDIWETGKHIIFGKPEGGPDLADHGIIPGLIHTFAEGIHKIGEGIHHIFAGDEEEHLGLLSDKQPAAETGNDGPHSNSLADVGPVTNGPASAVNPSGSGANPAMPPNAEAPLVKSGAPVVNPGAPIVNSGPLVNAEAPKVSPTAPLVNVAPEAVNSAGVPENTAEAAENAVRPAANAAGKVPEEVAKPINPR